MKRIKQIIEALKVLSRVPSKSIREAMSSVMIDVHNAALDGRGGATNEQTTLVENLLAAIVGLAEDMERDEAKKGQGDAKA